MSYSRLQPGKKFISLALSGLVIIAFAFLIFSHHLPVLAQKGGGSPSIGSSGISAPGKYPLYGFAWAAGTDSNGKVVGVGWINFGTSSQGYGGVVASTTSNNNANLEGYAWANPYDSSDSSQNIGWLSFNDTCGSGSPATINLSNGAVSGGARFISSNASNDPGWDGCVSLSGNGAHPYGGTITNLQFTTDSYFWGGPQVVGWIHMCNSSGAHPYCVGVSPNQLSCPAAPLVTNFRVTSPANTCPEIDLTWDQVNPDGGYVINKYENGSIIQTFNLPPTQTSLPDTNVFTGHTYSYQIAAVNGCGENGTFQHSVPPSITPAGTCPNPPSGGQVTLYADPATVPRNHACTLHYGTGITTAANGCVFTTTDNQFNHNFAGPSPLDYGNGDLNQANTSNLTSTKLYTLTCTSTGNGQPVSASAYCYVSGSYRDH